MDEQASSGVNSWLAALSGGLNSYIDSQNPGGYYVAQPAYQTEYGTAGQAQAPTASLRVAANSPVMWVAFAVIAYLLLRK
jgi:hypothetical protein